MLKRVLITLVVFCLVGGLVFTASALADPQEVSLPAVITPDTPCPVAACTQPDGACHTADPAPVPDGSFTMICPEIRTCSNTSCHAWDSLETYKKPRDISLNLWILAPILITSALVALIRKMR